MQRRPSLPHWLPLVAAATLGCGRASPSVPPGVNPHPIHLIRPAAHLLSPMAQLGRAIFFDRRLSATGAMSCATCHSPAQAFASPGSALLPPESRATGFRAVPSLRYLERLPNFAIGPDDAEAENVDVAAAAARAALAPRGSKVSRSPAARALVPQGGLFWDGRANTLEEQAMMPLLNPDEMANPGVDAIAARLRATSYAVRLARLVGTQSVATARRLVDEAMFAVARYQIEDPSFHPYDSKYDAWLEGRAVLTPQEMRGLAVFDDPRRGNCAACHTDRPAPDGTPPLFTDRQFEALGVPRNHALAASRDPRFFDLGLCGPLRTDLAAQRQYCGMFRTPTLRNVATRRVFFHNGAYRSLEQVLRFYNLRDVDPAAIFPSPHHDAANRFDDIPAALRGNVDTLDPPFGRHRGAAPPMTDAELTDLEAFLRTLTDGYEILPTRN